MTEMSESLTNFLEFRVRNRDLSVNCLSRLQSFIDNEIESKQKKICCQRIKVKVSRGIWTSQQRRVQLILNKNLNHSMISTIDGIRYLEPFQALYLMESHCLEVFFDDIPLSIEESFKLFLQNDNQINNYRIFSTLLRSGYSVKQHISPKRSQMSSTRKRKLSHLDIDYSKQFELNTNSYELSSKIANYKTIKSIKPMDPLNCDNSLSCSQNKSIVYEIEDTESPVELDPLLTLFNGSVKPLCDLGYLYSNDQLFNLMQSFGPKTLNTTNATESKFDFSLDVFKLSTKKVNRNPDFSVIVTKCDERVPQINDILSLEKTNSSEKICFAVLDSNDFAFYSVSSLQINEELSVLWQKHLKPVP